MMKGPSGALELLRKRLGWKLIMMREDESFLLVSLRIEEENKLKLLQKELVETLGRTS